MPEETSNNVLGGLLGWLQTERTLGVTHYAVPPGSPRSAAPSRSAPAPVEKAAPATRPPPRAEPIAPAPPPGRGATRTASVPPPALPLVPPDEGLPPFCDRELSSAEAEAALAELNERHVRGCRKCRLHEQRTQTVFGVGTPRPQLVFVGEGPGADEDAKGEPFVGRAGQLLTKMIAAMTLTREQVYICNVVKCRPPGNRTPAEDEMATCSPFLWRQLAILRPKVIVALGRPATQTLLGSKEAMSRLRGSFYAFPTPGLAGMPLAPAEVMPTYHPAYLLRNPDAKRDVWEDLQKVMALLGLRPARP